ncbi:hypothetical protein [Nocardia sp. NPDC052566]|uniref:hypothetical protein n=1 Tax=Nocardia sp. NPDC052566 TaxID=3364330 RepID=UPI0037C6DA2A
MTDFDRIYALVQEINRDWNRAVMAIRNREPLPPAEQYTVPIVDNFDGTDFGWVVIDSRGVLQSINLDPDEVSQASENHVLEALLTTLNGEFGTTRPTGTAEGNR